MKKLYRWFHFDATINAKILLGGGIVAALSILGCTLYNFAIIRRLYEETAKFLSEEELEQYLATYRPAAVSSVIFAIFLLIAGLLFIAHLSGPLGRRLIKLSKQAEALADDELSNIPLLEDKDEIGIVSNSFSRMATKLGQKVKEAYIANSAKNDFLSRMSHDIRTPMNGIRGMVEMMKDNPEDVVMLNDCLKKIDVSTNHLLILIDEMLDMSRLDNGTLEFTTDCFDIEDIIKQAIRTANESASESDISLNFECDIVNNRVIGSEIYTKRIIVNILNNAIKFNRTYGNVEVIVKERSIDSSRSSFEFSVSDTGIGMSEEFLQKVFEPFTQQDNGARTVYNGTGLGLSICYKLIELMGGKINIDSELGVGTTVHFSVPLQLNNKAMDDTERRAAFSRADLTGSRVLVVEDNALNMEIAKYMLTEKGMIVEEAVNGKEAVDKFVASTPFTYDFILMDIMMPVMDGLEAAKEIRKCIRQDAKIVPIIALSANAYADDINGTKAAGMNGHIAKPIDVDILFEVLIRQKRLYDALKIDKPYSQLFTSKNLD